MGLKDEFNKVVENVKDAASETGHRSDAEGEQAKRDVAGDTMTTSEKAGSMLNQAKNNVQAKADSTKRDIRNS